MGCEVNRTLIKHILQFDINLQYSYKSQAISCRVICNGLLLLGSLWLTDHQNHYGPANC